MQHGSYAALVDAADGLRSTLVRFLEAWEDEVDAGEAVNRPGEFPESFKLFSLAIDASDLARNLADHRVVATAEAA